MKNGILVNKILEIFYSVYSLYNQQTLLKSLTANKQTKFQMKFYSKNKNLNKNILYRVCIENIY